jgi:WD40 repeat protein
VGHVAFSPDGKTLVSVGDEDRSVRVWEVALGKLLSRVAVGKDEMPHAAAFGADGTLFVVGEAPTCVAWDLKANRRLFTRNLNDAGNSVACSPDGKTLVVGLDSGKTVLLDAATGVENCTLTPQAEERAVAPRGPVIQLMFTPDGTKLAATTPTAWSGCGTWARSGSCERSAPRGTRKASPAARPSHRTAAPWAC